MDEMKWTAGIDLDDAELIGVLESALHSAMASSSMQAPFRTDFVGATEPLQGCEDRMDDDAHILDVDTRNRNESSNHYTRSNHDDFDNIVDALVSSRNEPDFHLHALDVDERYMVDYGQLINAIMPNLDLNMPTLDIDLENILVSTMEALDSLGEINGGCATPFRIQLRSNRLQQIMGDSLVGADCGGPFQGWLRALAQLLFSPRAGLFLPAVCGDPAMLRISPIPGAGCIDAAVRLQLQARGAAAVYRLVGRVMGFALRRHPQWPGRLAPYGLGPFARLVPSIWNHLLAGADYTPSLHELRWATRKRVCVSASGGRAAAARAVTLGRSDGGSEGGLRASEARGGRLHKQPEKRFGQH